MTSYRIEIRRRNLRNWATPDEHTWGSWYPKNPNTKYCIGHDQVYKTEEDAIAAASRRIRKLESVEHRFNGYPLRQYKLVKITETITEEDTL
jgi:hypothetical protein